MTMAMGMIASKGADATLIIALEKYPERK